MATFEERVLELVNQERALNGLDPLTLHPLLAETAEGHSQSMALQDFFSHTGLDGSSPSDRALENGYEGGVGENIAAGYWTPEAVMDGWMSSSGHRANILNADYKSIGIGHYHLSEDTGDTNYHHYWTQVFGFSLPPEELEPVTISMTEDGGHLITVDDTSLLSDEHGTLAVDEVQTSNSIDVLPDSIENVTLTGVTDANATGNDNENVIQGNDGANQLNGGLGNDEIHGGLGDDVVFGNQDNDLIFGDGGFDNLRGSIGDDVVYGNTNADSLNGGLGNDELRGGRGLDNLRGARGDDVMIGGRGSDVLVGGTGNDILTGGEAGDFFVFDQPGGGISTGIDIIADFTPGEDKILISTLVNGIELGSVIEVLSRLTTDGIGGSVIDLGGGNSITLLGVPPEQLSADDFIIV